MPELPRFARIALPVPLGQAFTYRIPDALPVEAGSRVLVEFGRRKCLGVVLDLSSEAPADVAESKLKPILSLVDREKVLPDELRVFLLELARYYLAPLGEVLRLALPSLERETADELMKSAGKKLKAVGRLLQTVEIVPGAAPSGAAAPVLRGNAQKLLERLQTGGPLSLAELTDEFSTARSIVKRLTQAGLVKMGSMTKASDPFFDSAAPRDTPPELNHAQRAAVDTLKGALDSGAPAQFLLDGITASGKTEVYLHVAAHALSMSRGVILLVPEIALTPQLVHRFRARLGDEIAVLHSALSEQARLGMWKKLRSGELRVVVGARSALFAPVQALGLICVDEEHDSSYKQEEGVRYNARDMALLRAHRASAVCVVGSATPSLSSEAAVRQGKMQRLLLPARAHKAATLPRVELIDLTKVGPGPSGDPLLSLVLHRAVEENLAQGGQTILFLNRRGFAPSLRCSACGTLAECPHCSVALTLHRSRGARLICHYCDFQSSVPDTCPGCSSKQLSEEGLGTEQVEEKLKQAFPTARIARLDRDVAGGRKSEAIVDAVRKGQIDILVGTQMVTKGHDLPGVTLVGVLNADAALSLPDFRASERTFHLLVQVAGRAGRADAEGRVLIQTRTPDHPAIVSAVTHDVTAFVESEMRAREELSYPPFSHIALVRFDGMHESEVASEARRLSTLVEQEFPEMELLGPAPAPLARLRNRYRYRFMLRSLERAPLRKTLLFVARAKVASKVRVTIDVDPQSML